MQEFLIDKSLFADGAGIGVAFVEFPGAVFADRAGAADVYEVFKIFGFQAVPAVGAGECVGGHCTTPLSKNSRYERIG